MRHKKKLKHQKFVHFLKDNHSHKNKWLILKIWLKKNYKIELWKNNKIFKNRKIKLYIMKKMICTIK